MKFFFLFFLVVTLLCGYFWATDAPCSGMVWPTGISAVIALAVGGYNWAVNGSPLSDSTKR